MIIKKISYLIVLGVVVGFGIVGAWKLRQIPKNFVKSQTVVTGSINSTGSAMTTGSIINSSGSQVVSGIGTKTNPLVYTNTEYGFQLTLPKGWEKYRAFVYKGNDKFPRGVAIALPTTMLGYKGVIDPSDSNNFSSSNTGSYTYIKGYAVMVDMIVLDKNAYENQYKRCKKNKEPGCPGAVLGDNNLYYYIVVGPQTLTTDLDKQWGDRSYFDKIYKTFKLL